jgi:hypothetical protein
MPYLASSSHSGFLCLFKEFQVGLYFSLELIFILILSIFNLFWFFLKHGTKMPFEIHKPDNKYEIEEIAIFKLKISFLQLTKN